MFTRREEQISIKANHLDGIIGQYLFRIWEGNLKKLNWEEHFLAPFRKKNSKPGAYIGLGKTLSGLIHSARHFGLDAEILKKQIVHELIDTQEPDGYIGLYIPENRTYRTWDVHEQAYIIQALIEDFIFFGNKEALEAAEKLSGWLLPRISEGQLKKIAIELWNPLTIIGLDRAFLALGSTTGNSCYTDFCKNDLMLDYWFEPIIEGRQGRISGHAYAYIARCLAQLETTDLNRMKCLPEATQAVISYFRSGGGLVISGSCGQTECWHSDQRQDGNLGETCATAYLIRWAAHLLYRTYDAWFGDLMERAIYNALFSALSPDGRKIRYYSASEGVRKWHESDTYCCPGNFRRIMGELPDFIARKYRGGIAVDLYETCSISTCINEIEAGFRIKTGYPFESTITLVCETKSQIKFPLYLRYPGWADGVNILCNGAKVSSCEEQGWIMVDRIWCQDDRLEVTFDMPWKLIGGFRTQAGKTAIMRGPIIWGADKDINEEYREKLNDFIPDLSTCIPDDNWESVTVSGVIEGQHACLKLIPYYAMDNATTYFASQMQMRGERDHLLWIGFESE